MMIDLAYYWGEIWARKYHAHQSQFWMYTLISTAVVLYALEIALLILNF